MVENKRKIIKRISSIFIACASALMLCISPFLPKFQPKTMIASADEVSTGYSFNGSSIVTVSSSIQEGVGYALGFFNFEVDLNNYNGYIESDIEFKYFYPGIGYDSVNTTQQVNFSNEGEPLTYTSFHQTVNNANHYYFSYALGCDYGFNCFVKKVRIYSTESMLNTHTMRIYTYIDYYDENDKVFSIRIPCDITGENAHIASYFEYTDRYYYLVGTFLDDDVFKEGYDSGYSIGENVGYDNGYSAGSRAGEVIGYNNGYQAGANASNSYTFFSLISAVIDAPVQAFMGLFNFELLGVNLAGFFTGLLTLAFIVSVVRLLI